jgi:elongation factor Ts
MVEISAKDVMTLRGRTSAGIMDAKKALQETNGDMDQAADLLRKWGAGRADAKMANEMKEGLIGGKVSADRKLGVILRLGCQTDFVARNDAFVKLLADLVAIALATPVSTAAELGQQAYTDGSGRTVDAVIKELVGGSIKENMAVTGLARFSAENGAIGMYIHHNAKVGAMVQIDGSSDAKVTAVAQEIAMHVTAGVPMVPVAVAREQVDAAHVEQEKAEAQEAHKNKPAQVLEKIINSRLEKFFGEHVLLEQPFVKDEKKQVRELLSHVGTAVNAKLTLAKFSRFKVGEA